MDGTTRQPAAGDGVLVNARWLEAHLDDPEVRVVEVDVNRRDYDEWHIDGAVLWNVYQDLKDADYRSSIRGDRRLLAAPASARGSTVVLYGYAPALGFWLMRLHGHDDCGSSTALGTPGGVRATRGPASRLSLRRGL